MNNDGSGISKAIGMIAVIACFIGFCAIADPKETSGLLYVILVLCILAAIGACAMSNK